VLYDLLLSFPERRSELILFRSRSFFLFDLFGYRRISSSLSGWFMLKINLQTAIFCFMKSNYRVLKLPAPLCCTFWWNKWFRERCLLRGIRFKNGFVNIYLYFNMLCNFIPTYREINTTILKKLMVATNCMQKWNILPNRVKLRKYGLVIENYFSKCRFGWFWRVKIIEDLPESHISADYRWEYQKLALITDILNKDYTKQNPKRVPMSPTITSAVSGVRPGMKNWTPSMIYGCMSIRTR
jgi:hypothetical protein